MFNNFYKLTITKLLQNQQLIIKLGFINYREQYDFEFQI